MSPEQKAEAQKAFDDAMTAFGEKRFGDAADGFRASYELLPSPNSRLMIVRSLGELGQKADAYEEGLVALAEAEAAGQSQKKYELTAKAIREEMADLRPKIGFVRVTVRGVGDRGVRLVVEGRDVARSRWAELLAADPGKVRVELFTAEGRATQEVDVRAGAESSLTIEPAKTVAQDGARGAGGDSQGGNPQLFVPAAITGGIGVVGLVVFGVLGGLSDATYRDLEGQCPNNNCPRELESDMTHARSQQTIGNVSAVVGAIGLTAGAVLFAFGEWDIVGLFSGAEGQTSSQARLRVGPGTMSLQGKF